MALSYTTLVAGKSTAGSIANWASRDDLPTAYILEEAQQWIYDRLRAREMITETSLSISSAAESASAPSDFMQSIAIRLYEDSRPLDMKDVNGLEEDRVRDSTGALPEGKPIFYAAVPDSGGAGGTYYFDVKADQAYTGRQWYFARPALLSGSNETNFMTVRYPTMLRRACMIFAFEHRMDFARSKDMELSVMNMIQEAAVTADMALSGAIFDSEVR